MVFSNPASDIARESCSRWLARLETRSMSSATSPEATVVVDDLPLGLQKSSAYWRPTAESSSSSKKSTRRRSNKKKNADPSPSLSEDFKREHFGVCFDLPPLDHVQISFFLDFRHFCSTTPSDSRTGVIPFDTKRAQD